MDVHPPLAIDEGRPWRRIAVSYLTLQTLAVIAWWLWLLANPAAMRLFVGPRLPAQTLRAYLLPDALLYGCVGPLAAFLIHRRHPHAWPALILLAGGILYATLSTLALAIDSQGGWIGVPLMAASSAATLSLAWRLRPV